MRPSKNAQGFLMSEEDSKSNETEKRLRKIKVTRTIDLPDQFKTARCLRAPEFGPTILFFSGGTALRGLSQKIIEYTHNSIHLITPFDSGGSSAELRRAFEMPSVGDIRNRILALADVRISGIRDTYELFSIRLPEDFQKGELEKRLKEIVSLKDQMIKKVPEHTRKIISNYLNLFSENMPDDFDLSGASIGNLILAGGYLNNGGQLDPVIFLFSELVEARGTVRPTVNKSMHVIAKMSDGKIIKGQHLLGKTSASEKESMIEDVYLGDSGDGTEFADVRAREQTLELIKKAEVICYPMGSFFSSILINLIPKGVGSAIASNDCPKIYIPNTGHDPEERGTSLSGRIRKINEYNARDIGGSKKIGTVDYVFLDSGAAGNISKSELKEISKMGVELIEDEFVTKESEPYYEDKLLIEALLSLA